MRLQGCSIWLLLPLEIKQQLSFVINGLSGSYEAPSFEPHITLLGSLPKTPAVLKKAQELFEVLPPVRIQLKGLGCSQKWSKCLFIEVEATQELSEAHEMAKRYVEDKRVRTYQPHISLLYGRYSQKVKNQIMETLDGWVGTAFIAHSAAVVSTEGAPQNWVHLHSGPLRDAFAI